MKMMEVVRIKGEKDKMTREGRKYGKIEGLGERQDVKVEK